MSQGRSRRGRGRAKRGRECAGKKQYVSREAAVVAALALGRRSGGRFHAYKCRHCYIEIRHDDGDKAQLTAWHVGHSAPLGRRLGR